MILSPRQRDRNGLASFAFLLGTALLAVLSIAGNVTGDRSEKPVVVEAQGAPSESDTARVLPPSELPVVEPLAASPPTLAPLAQIQKMPPVLEYATSPLAPPPPVTAHTFAVLDRTCGVVIYGSGSHERVAPASVTKIITALVVRQHASLDERVTVNVSGKEMKKRGSSVMGIEPGQVYTVRELLAGLMLPSGNDAAVALAEHVGKGDTNAFVNLMNQEAARLGMTDTHFTNPHGLDSGQHYSSAADMAIAGQAYMSDSFLAELARIPNFATEPGLAFKNGNKLLGSYPGAYGVKIGFTGKAGQTIVAGAVRDGRDLIVSTMHSTDRYADAKAILDWAFAALPSPCKTS